METSIEQVILISNWDIMYNQNQFWPKIDKFPWFRPDQVEWLEKKTAHLPEGERQQTQQGLYRELLPRVIAKQRNEQRMAVKNEYYQKNLQKPDKERQLWNMYLRQEDLADIVKSNFGLKHDLSTEDTMKGIRKYMANDNIDEQYLLDYLNGKNDELLYQLEIKERKPEGKYQSGALKGMLSRAGGNWGIWEWVNPIGRATEYLDDLIQKIPAVSFEGREEELRKRIDAVGEEERKAFEETFKNNRTLQALYGNVDNYIKESKKTFMDQFLGIGDKGPNVVKQILNIPWSFLKTASWISRAMTNPLDTVVGLKNLLTTEEWRQLVIDRYWTNFQQTLEEDPIGLASDVLSVVGMWWGALAKGAKLAGLESTASKIGKFASVADNVGDLGLDVVKAKGMGMLGEIGGGWNALTKAGVKYVQLTQAPLQTAGEMTKGIIKALPSAEHTLQNMNRLTKWEQSKFKSIVWESQGEWMNNRGIVAGGESAVDQLAEYFVNSKKKVDEALQTIEGEYKNPYLDMMAKEASEFAENTLSKEAWRIKELAQKAETQGLTMSEINEVKRFYEKNNKFTYGKDITAGEKSVRATNIDNNVREWQMDIAEENGFWNLRELNKETQASKFLLDKLVKNNDGSFGNNFFTLTDYITAVWLWDITALPWIFTKKMMSSDWFRTNYAKIINKINGHQTIAEKIADIEVIKKIQNKKALEKFLKDDYNTKNQNLNSNSNQDAIDLHVHSRGASLDDWQSIQKQTAQIEGSLWEINEGASWRVWLKWNIERSDGKKALTEESIIEKYRQKAIQELWLPEWTTEINLAELMGDKKKYAKYQEITAEMQKELWYLWEDGYYTKKWHDDLESRKRKAYGEQKHSLRDDEGLNKLREWAETRATTQLHKEAQKYNSAEEFVKDNTISRSESNAWGVIKYKDWELRYSLEVDDNGIDYMIIDNIESKTQKQGIWTILMKEAENIATEKWLERIELWAYPQNNSITSESLKNFYEKLWYQVNSDTLFDWKTYYDMSTTPWNFDLGLKSEKELLKIRKEVNSKGTKVLNESMGETMKLKDPYQRDWNLNPILSRIGKPGSKTMKILDISDNVKTMLKKMWVDSEIKGHYLSSNGVQHILKRHGEWAKNLKFYEIPVSIEDIKLIPKIISEADEIMPSSKTTGKLNRPAIIYKKKMGNKYYYVESINTKNGKLEPQSMYINKP